MRYAGIGATDTPILIQNRMTFLARELEAQGHILHSGGAKSADTAFEVGVLSKDNKRIFIPERGWNGSDSELILDEMKPDLIEASEFLVTRYHPAPDRLGGISRKLMARNSFQVLDKTLDDPVDFVICWTPNAKITGGTGQAMRIAKDHGIKVYNLADIDDTIEIFSKVFKGIEDNPLGL